ncbi:hypothetical protein LX32DRAFT_638565 [Colletotrichum zoysiae]|uniref:Secreted protein n=1 Tax=Colletotrichum zoysiae TaxID=1216348 RepID=A0AAD9HIV1_9PEZI|nr:hypothetical protein LX32DRAFT_638565 [Colletotrichum zoysiae]
MTMITLSISFLLFFAQTVIGGGVQYSSIARPGDDPFPPSPQTATSPAQTVQGSFSVVHRSMRAAAGCAGQDGRTTQDYAMRT